MTTEQQGSSRPRVVLRAMVVAAISAFVGAVSAFGWYVINSMNRLGGFLSPEVSADLSVQPASVPSPFPPAFAIAAVEVLLAVVVVAWILTPASRRRLSPAAIVLGPLALWLAVAIQFMGGSFHWPISTSEMLFVRSAQELAAVGVVVLLPPIVAAAAIGIRGRRGGDLG